MAEYTKVAVPADFSQPEHHSGLGSRPPLWHFDFQVQILNGYIRRMGFSTFQHKLDSIIGLSKYGKKGGGGERYWPPLKQTPTFLCPFERRGREEKGLLPALPISRPLGNN